jgi:hypothetical protein
MFLEKFLVLLLFPGTLLALGFLTIEEKRFIVARARMYAGRLRDSTKDIR